MGMFRLLLLVFVLSTTLTSSETKNPSCHHNICDVMTKLDEFETNLSKFTTDNNLESGHKALKTELEIMGHNVIIGKDKPLQTYLIRFQKIIQEQTYIKTEQLLEDESVYISQEFRDLENMLKEQEKNIVVKFDHLEKNLKTILKEQNKNNTFISDELRRNNRKLNISQDNFFKEFMNQKNLLAKLLEDQHNNIARISESLNKNDKKIDSLQINLEKKLEEQDKNDVVIYNVLKLITEKLDNINLPKEKKNYGTTILNMIDNEIENMTTKMDTSYTTQEWKDEQISTMPVSEITKISNPFDCLEILEAGEHKNGIYHIYPQGREFNVYCDMSTNGGGWTVFLNREKQEPQLNFKRNWQDYKNGFGSPSGELWLGNEALHLMTAAKRYSFRVDAVGKGTPTNNWEEYSTFRVSSEDQKYRLTLNGYNNNSSMHDNPYGFGYNDGSYFGTIDVDNDIKDTRNCAEWEKGGNGGGFWYKSCTYISPTGVQILFGRWSKTDGTNRIPVSSLQMKIRQQNKE